MQNVKFWGDRKCSSRRCTSACVKLHSKAVGSRIWKKQLKCGVLQSMDETNFGLRRDVKVDVTNKMTSLGKKVCMLSDSEK